MEYDTIKLGDDERAKRFKVSVGAIGTYTFIIQDYAATCEQDAIDIVADYCDDRGWVGWFGSEQDTIDYWLDDDSMDNRIALDTWIIAGNYSKLFTSEIWIEEIFD